MKEPSKIRELLKAIAQESEVLQLLKDDPQQLKERFNLTDEELNALKNSEMLFVSSLP